MNPHEILRRFPLASKSLLAANAAYYGSGVPTATPETPSKPKAGGLAKPRGRKGMNKTEASFATRLEAQLEADEIISYAREGITLRWPDGMTYTPDFAALRRIAGTPYHDLLLIETKGAWIEQDALVKFRAARAHWVFFAFEMWQLKKREWSQLL